MTGKKGARQPMLLEELLEQDFERRASDLHLSAGLPPVFRIDGKLVRGEYAPLSKEDCQRLIFSILTNEQRRILEQNWELDCSYGVSGLGRFRVNVYKDKGNYAAALRSINTDVPSFEQL